MKPLASNPATLPSPRRTMLWRWAAGSLLALVLLGVFSLYTQPEFFFTMANQVWACF